MCQFTLRESPSNMAGRTLVGDLTPRGPGLRPADMAFELVPGSPWKNWRMHLNGVLCIAAQSVSSTRSGPLHGGYASTAPMQAGYDSSDGGDERGCDDSGQVVPLTVALHGRQRGSLLKFCQFRWCVW